jgi:vanillate O-demethylase ferredoxin subunit
MAAPLTVRVARRRTEAEGICSFELVAADGGSLPAFEAGSHIDVQVPGGPMRPYSLCSVPSTAQQLPSRYQIAVLRESASRGGSAGMHERVAEGDLLQISAPRNLFPLSATAAHHVLMAGGIGITPMLAMAEALAAAGTSFELHYCTRSAARTAFAQYLRAAPFADAVQFHHDDGPPAQRFDIALRLAEPQAGVHLYVCGPRGFMDAVLGTARAMGWPESQIHSESFGAAPVAQACDGSFEVVLHSSQRVVVVPTGRSIVQALADAGVDIVTSCEQGVCGTCLTGVVDGTPDHRDQYLTPEEQAAGDQILPCCSRSKTARLVLAL